MDTKKLNDAAEKFYKEVAEQFDGNLRVVGFVITDTRGMLGFRVNPSVFRNMDRREWRTLAKALKYMDPSKIKESQS